MIIECYVIKKLKINFINFINRSPHLVIISFSYDFKADMYDTCPAFQRNAMNKQIFLLHFFFNTNFIEPLNFIINIVPTCSLHMICESGKERMFILKTW